MLIFSAKPLQFNKKWLEHSKQFPHRAFQGIELPYLRIYQYDDIPP